MMTFRWYEREVFGNSLKYPADHESMGLLIKVGGTKVVQAYHLSRLEFFGVVTEEVKRSEAEANYR